MAKQNSSIHIHNSPDLGMRAKGISIALEPVIDGF